MRAGGRGYADGLQGGMVIGLPPVMNFGSPELKKRILPDVFAGKKFISLAISEPFAGSGALWTSCSFRALIGTSRRCWLALRRYQER